MQPIVQELAERVERWEVLDRFGVPFQTAVRGALAKNPDARYDDASALLGGCRLWEHVGNRQPPFYGRFVQNNHRRQKDNGYGSYTRTNYHEAPAH